MRDRNDEIADHGAELVFVGNGSLDQARRFHLTHAPHNRVLTDASLRSYTALGFTRSVAATLGLASVAAGIRSTMRGHVQKSVQGDPWQQGGMFVLAKGGRTVYAQRNRHAGERTDLGAALRMLAEAEAPKGR